MAQISFEQLPQVVTQLYEKVDNIERMLSEKTKDPASIEPKRLFGDKAAAEYLGCRPLTIAKLRKNGTIPYYRYGSRYYYLSTELDDALKGGARRFGELRGERIRKGVGNE